MAASASASAADTTSPTPRFLQTRVVTVNERNRKAEKLRAATPAFPSDKEVGWHLARVEGAPDASATIVFLMVALSYPELWMTMARVFTWLGRHSVKPATRWHTWNYFCNRMPVTNSVNPTRVPERTTRKSLTRSLRGGWRHGISFECRTYGQGWPDTIISERSHTTILSFAGRLANLGPVVPAAVKYDWRAWGDTVTVTKVTLSWSQEFQLDRPRCIIGISYTKHSDSTCYTCKTKGALTDVIVIRAGFHGGTYSKKYGFLCQICRYAKYKEPMLGAEYTTHDPVIDAIVQSIPSDEELEADALIQKYQEFIDDDDFDLPQQDWRMRKKTVVSPSVQAERERGRKRKEAARAAALKKRLKVRADAVRKRKAAARAKRSVQKTKAKRTAALARKREPPKKRARKD